MMSGMPLETCWAFNKLWNDKFYCKVASCWLFILIPKKKLYWTLDCWRWGCYGVSKRRDPIAHWRNFMSHKNGIVRYTPAETSKLTHVFLVLFKINVTEALKWLSMSVMDLYKYRYASLNDGDKVLRNASLGDFVFVLTCTYTNLGSTV
jgi:hypothetical protein